MVDYLTDPRQMVKIDDRKSDMATLEFGVPQGFILGPVILISTSLIFKSNYGVTVISTLTIRLSMSTRSPATLGSSAAQINKTIAILNDYSNNGNLALNPTKTNWMLSSTPQMARYHSLEDRDLPIVCGDSALKRISCTKLLGVHMDQHLLSTSYGTLSVLRRLKNLAPFHVRKHLAESLVLSHLNYACTVFDPLPVYQEKRLQRLQNACAGFVTRLFADLEDIIKLNWLPVKENVEFNILKLAHKSLYDKNSFPEYLKLSLHQVTAYNLRSSTAPVFSIPKESGTFQH